MRGTLVVGAIMAALSALGCGASGEAPDASKCPDGICHDPAYPYCDVGGFLGDPETCQPACPAGVTVKCLGDNALTCTADSQGYEQRACEMGCVTDPAPHCRHIEPRFTPDVCKSYAANELLVIGQDETFDPNVDANCNGGIVAQTGAPGICVVRYRRILVEAPATLTVLGAPNGLLGRSIAFVADEELRVDGALDLGARGSINGPGGGVYVEGSGGGAGSDRGAGGAGGETDGGDGGNSSADGGAMNGGAAVGDPALRAVFVGGWQARKYFGPDRGGGGGGGAASLIACSGKVAIAGTLNAAGGGGGSGHPGGQELPATGGFGGGAGGYVILQGLDVSVTGQMFANGGGGGAGYGGNSGMDGQMSATAPAQGGTHPGDSGRGGDGGVGTSPPMDGAKPVVSGLFYYPGGGGGSVGFFQTFMPSGRTPTLTPSAVSPPFLPNVEIQLR